MGIKQVTRHESVCWLRLTKLCLSIKLILLWTSDAPSEKRCLNEVVASGIFMAVGAAHHRWTSSSANRISVMRLMRLSDDDEACTP